MRNINPTFTDQEYEKLKQAKDQIGGGWHDILLTLAERFLNGSTPLSAQPPTPKMNESEVDNWGKATIGRPYKGKTIEWRLKDVKTDN